MIKGIKNCNNFQLLLWGFVVFFNSSSFAQTDTNSRVLLDMPNYPEVFELDPGESHTVIRKTDQKIIRKRVKLISVTPYFEPNYWFGHGIPKLNYAYAKVVVEVNEERVILLHRPYQMPVTVNGLRLYVEAVKGWAKYANIAQLRNIQKQARLSAVAVGESWGPKSITFPIKDYRWRSSSYNNTWSALVPYNKLYYHRGEDYGAIPDRLEVVAPISGTIIATPLPDGDGHSNAIFIRNKQGIIFRIAHMNIETIKPKYTVGTQVKAGTLLAKTGMTWDGHRSQVNDPHCHIAIRYSKIKQSYSPLKLGDNKAKRNSMPLKLASYPFLMEAYFRSYPDSVLAVAGGYQFTIPGKEVRLDGSRSLARQGQHITSYTWKLHTGKKISGVTTTLTYSNPGLYTEELIVETKSGAIDRDFLQVRVWNRSHGRNIAYGWVHKYPVRHIKVDTPVLFWNRLINTKKPVIINFGDGSPTNPIKKEITHSYSKPGHYVVTFSARGPLDEPITEKLEVRVVSKK